MALNISLLVVPWPVFLIALIIIVTSIIILTVIEIKLGKKAKEKKTVEETYYQRKLSNVLALKSDASSFLSALDKVSREFFSEDLGRAVIGRNVELIEELKKRGKGKGAAFCEKMQEALYSGEKIDNSLLASLFNEMKSFVSEKERMTVQLEKEQTVKENYEQKAELNKHILEYITEGLNRGFDLNSLEKKLIGSGFDEAAVLDVVSHMSQKQKVEQTEKKMVTKFFNPSNKEMEVIKRSIVEKDEVGRGEIIEVVPYKEEQVKKKEVKYPEKEPESYKNIEGLDDLRRVKEKIAMRKSNLKAKL